MGRSTPSESHAPADIDAGASVAYSRSIAMPIAIVSLVAMCTLAGCRGGNVVGIALLIAIAIAAAIRNGISQSQQKMPALRPRRIDADLPRKGLRRLRDLRPLWQRDLGRRRPSLRSWRTRSACRCRRCRRCRCRCARSVPTPATPTPGAGATRRRRPVTRSRARQPHIAPWMTL